MAVKIVRRDLGTLLVTYVDDNGGLPQKDGYIAL